MENFLKNFEVENKNPSEEAIRRWRNAVALVKNPRRRFRFVADLAKRYEAEKKKRQIQTNSAEWIFLATSLCMEILSAACDQASSPSKPRYALFGMLLAFASLLTCIWELIYKGMKKNVVWGNRGCHMLFGSDIELFALVGGIAQCVCSIIQYIYYVRHADNPIKMSLLPAIFVICLIATRLSRERMQTTYETGEHTA
ncbi:uncharacterized protein LOC125469500 isoform X2 [Pyrus x bretschneideri]|uniref:uncharacterized protein LOC125469500 isoform X2 n=1 Tax=Pyrus x bretschneideri TaxID=225117 RepID=UPI00202E90B2|nr:uncharacterized protein LOC125469500 isoform X2 [Pyrus x bretschneideri]